MPYPHSSRIDGERVGHTMMKDKQELRVQKTAKKSGEELMSQSRES